MLALVLVAFSLGLSNFAASIGIGVSGATPGTRLRVGLVFGMFEAGIPIAGLLLATAWPAPWAAGPTGPAAPC